MISIRGLLIPFISVVFIFCAASVDAQFPITPTFADANQYSMEFSPGNAPKKEGGCPNDPKSYISIVRVNPGAYRVQNTCKDKAIHASWTTFGVPCRSPNSSSGSHTIAAGGYSSVVSDCRPPELKQATFSR